MKESDTSGGPLTDRHELVKTVYLWRNGTCHRIEIVGRGGKPGEPVSYVVLLWVEREHGPNHRILVRDVTFPWVHHDNPDSALKCAIEFLESVSEECSTM